MRNLIYIFIIYFLIFPILTFAAPKSVELYIEKPKIVGSGRLSFWMWDVYDASLYAEDGLYKTSKPFALYIKYLMPFRKESLANRTIQEIKRQGYNDNNKLSLWKSQLINIFPDVEKGDAITAIYLDVSSVGFFVENKSLGYINSPEFTRKFFDIWIGEKTSEQELRIKLLNLN